MLLNKGNKTNRNKNKTRKPGSAGLSLSFRICPSLNKETVMLVAGMYYFSLMYYEILQSFPVLTDMSIDE